MMDSQNAVRSTSIKDRCDRHSKNSISYEQEDGKAKVPLYTFVTELEKRNDANPRRRVTASSQLCSDIS